MKRLSFGFLLCTFCIAMSSQAQNQQLLYSIESTQDVHSLTNDVSAADLQNLSEGSLVELVTGQDHIEGPLKLSSRLVITSTGGTLKIGAQERHETELSVEGLKLANYPNPMVDYTTFYYVLPHTGEVSIKILDLEGRQVAVLFKQYQESGPHAFTWKMNSRVKFSLVSGTYLYQLDFGDQTKTGKIIIQ